jgi:hypothetical protein
MSNPFSIISGKNRQKIFADGRPQQTEIWTNDHNIPRSITPINACSVDILSSSPVDHVDVSEHTELANERLEQDATDNEVEWNWEEQEAEEKLVVATRIVPVTRPRIDDNIDDLDIKNKKLTKLQDEGEDFFSDFGMTPTINKVAVVPQLEESAVSVVDRLQMSIVADGVADEGWGDDENWDEGENL